jgi:ribose transport system substrate-binding protein
MPTAAQSLTRRVAASGIAVAALLSASACASTGGGSDDQMKIGVTVSNSTNPFFVKESQSAEAEGKKLGAEVLSSVADEDVQTQSNQIDQFITSQVDFIVIDPVDSDGVGPAVKRAVDAGIPVIGIDSVTKNATTSITTDNVQAGKVSCESLAKQLDGEGQIAILDGTPISAVSDRVDGCKETLKSYPDIEIVAEQRGDNSRDKALPVATDILTANPDIDGIFAINDPTAAGVELAAKQKGMDIIITSVDGAKAAVDTILADGMITATAAQDPKALAEQGVQVGAAILDGKDPESDVIELPTELIDASNAADYTPWG